MTETGGGGVDDPNGDSAGGVRAAEWVVDVGARDLPVVVDVDPEADRPVVLVEAGAHADPQSAARAAAPDDAAGADPLPIAPPPDTEVATPGAWTVGHPGVGASGEHLYPWPNGSDFLIFCESWGLRGRPVGIATGDTLRRLAWVGRDLVVATTADPITGRGTDAVPFDDAHRGVAGVVEVFGPEDREERVTRDIEPARSLEWREERRDAGR